MVTKAEVRALVLARLGPGLGRCIWDVGAGSGSIAVECARFGAYAIAVERDPEACARIEANAGTHGVDVAVVAGEAPAVLEGLPAPDAVFVGGGGLPAVGPRLPGVPAGSSPRSPPWTTRWPPGPNCGATATRSTASSSPRTDSPNFPTTRCASRPPTLSSSSGASVPRPDRRRRHPRRPHHQERVIALVTATAAGRRAAAELAGRWPSARSYPVAEIATAWRECDALVCFLATGATIRLLAPLLGDKATDPGVVVVDEGRRFAVALLGGHGGGANALADEVADALAASRS